ncbi:MAG TPA: glycosyltransferase [Pirellulales bacterium]|nr:glycosyltransferase [Pirellulales bacterium]
MHLAVVSPKPYATLVDKLGWVGEGFRAAGHDVVRVHDLAGVRAADEECELLLFDQKASGLNRAELTDLALAPRRARWVQWWRDLIALEPKAPLAEQPFVRSFGGLMRAMDLVLVKERGLLDEYASLGIHALWLDQACPEEMPPCKHPEDPEWDVLVLGSTAYDQRRQDAAALAAAGFRVVWAGLPGREPVPSGVEWRPWRHPTQELPQFVGRAAVVLGVDCRSDVPGYTSDRSHLVAGMGACYVARVPDYGADSAPGAASPAADVAGWIYDEHESLVNVVRTALADRDERQRRGRRSRELVMSQHTYRRRAEQIVELVGARSRAEMEPTGF